MKLILSLAVLMTLGCVKANPGFEVLDQDSVPRPTFNGQTSTTVMMASPTTTARIDGECDFKINAIVAQVIGVASAAAVSTLSTVADTPPVLSCQADGKFHFEIKSLSALGFTPVLGQTYEVQLRGSTTAGLSRASSIYLKYSIFTPDNPKGIIITGGGTESSSGQRQAASTNFKGEIRVGHSSTASTSPHFRAQIGTSVRAD